jgi:hypothetical protein
MVTSARTLTTVAWGLFFVLIGGAWMYGQAYGVDTGWIIAIGVGLILIGLNIARTRVGVRMGRFSLGIGILALVIGLAQYAGLKIDILPLIIILIGLFILAEAIVRR